MCGRFAAGGNASDYAEYFGVERVVADAQSGSHNIAPTDPVYTIAEWDGERLLGTMRWGLIPHWARDGKNPQINARAESIATKPMFRDSFSRKRCLLPADGFYEWEPKERGRTPHWVHRSDGLPMAFAGVWATWRDPAGDCLVRSCAIVTTRAEGVVSAIHDRMPVALDPTVWDAWLDRSITDPAQAEGLIRPIDPALITAHPVSSRVNSVRNDDPGLCHPAGG